MNIVDSSGWLEFFGGTKNAKNFRSVIKQTEFLIVPSVIIYEVFKKIIQSNDRETALLTIAHMKKGIVVDLDLEIALSAAKLSKEYKLPMADSVILATARQYNAVIYTQDVDFKGIKGVKYFKKR